MTACPKRKLVRDPKYRAWVRTQPCILCGTEGKTQAAHIRFGVLVGMGTKPGDDSVVPLCYFCHLEQHQKGERGFWTEVAAQYPLLLSIILQAWRRYEYAQYQEREGK